MDPIISCDNIHKTYLLGIEGVPALRGADVDINLGELLVLYGTSGGGKSTLLNVLGTIDTPTKGNMFLFGKRVTDQTPDSELAAMRLQRIGFVFQSFNLISTMDALGNVSLPMVIKGSLSASDIKKRATALLEEVGLGHRLHHFPSMLSGGEQQRVTIARALANEPEILFLDEPTGDLDTKNTLIIMNILLRLNRERGLTMVMVTHDVYIRQYAHRVIYIRDGKRMGCCNSKETKKPKEEVLQREAQYAKVSSETDSVEEQPNIEARVASVVKDLRAERIDAICAHSHACPYRYNACTVVGGEVKFYFEGGIIFCIVKEGSWYIYNDSLDYEAHVTVRFGPGSNIAAGQRAELGEVEDGWTCIRAIVYPLETVHLVSGTANGYKTHITIKPLNEQYRHEACAAANGTAEAETEAVRSLVTEGMDEKAILHRCVETTTPYVDLTFPPNGEAVARAGRDTRTIPEVAMMRPTQYLLDNNCLSVNDICGPVLALSIEPGNLGDSWFMCAVAIMAENEAAVRSIFAQGSPAEKAVGAYRVLVNKNGWWHTLIMDDYLPTFNRMPVFARSYDNPAEVWTSLLQKAYAKLHGSYAAITGGDTLQALADLSGAPMCRFDKEWEEATTDAEKADTLANALVQFSRSGACVVLSTPGHNSESYLGRSQASDAAAFRARYKKVGLHVGYTYSLERVVMVEECGTLLFKVRNPWRSSSKWTGPWSYGSREWDENQDACLLCGAQKDPQDGSFWMCWDDASRYFDGGGVLFANPDAVDYRVKGVFCKTIPSAVLEITASESTQVFFTLSQPDKRGVDRKEGAALFAPIMLTVSKEEDGVQRVQKNTSWNPTMPSEEFNFVVGRDVSMWFTLGAEEKYLVVPRIHSKGVKSDYDRPYVISIMSTDKLEGNVRVEAKHIHSDSKVFTNYIAYDSEELPSVKVENQVRLPGKAPVTYVSATVI